MLARYKVYEDFFGIEKRAAHYKVKKETLYTSDLKIFERFIHMLSVEDIDKIIKYVDEDLPVLNIKLKRDKVTHKTKSSVKLTHELSTIATIEGETYKYYKEINKSTNKILEEYKNKLEKEEEKRDLLNYERIELEEYDRESFENQNEFDDFDTYLLYLGTPEEKDYAIEKNHRKNQLIQKKIHIIDNVGNFLHAQETISMHCHNFFEEKIDLIVDSIAEKNIIQYMLDYDNAFTTHLDTFSELLKIPPKLVLYFGRESFTKLFKKYQIDYLL